MELDSRKICQYRVQALKDLLPCQASNDLASPSVRSFVWTTGAATLPPCIRWNRTGETGGKEKRRKAETGRMVFFVCDSCQESIKKNKVETHKSRCRNSWVRLLASLIPVSQFLSFRYFSFLSEDRDELATEMRMSGFVGRFMCRLRATIQR